MYADFDLWPSEFPFAARMLVQNVSHENHLIFMLMTVQVTYILISIVSHKADSFCRRGKSKLGIGLFIHELLREPLIMHCCFLFVLLLIFLFLWLKLDLHSCYFFRDPHTEAVSLKSLFPSHSIWTIMVVRKWGY